MQRDESDPRCEHCTAEWRRCQSRRKRGISYWNNKSLLKWPQFLQLIFIYFFSYVLSLHTIPQQKHTIVLARLSIVTIYVSDGSHQNYIKIQLKNSKNEPMVRVCGYLSCSLLSWFLINALRGETIATTTNWRWWRSFIVKLATSQCWKQVENQPFTIASSNAQLISFPQ